MLVFIFIIALTLNIVLSHVIASTARNKEIGYGTAFFVSFFFSPIIGVLLSIASPEVKKVVKNTKNDNVNNEAVVSRFSKEQLAKFEELMSN
jgi:predicted permease